MTLEPGQPVQWIELRLQPRREAYIATGYVQGPSGLHRAHTAVKLDNGKTKHIATNKLRRHERLR